MATSVWPVNVIQYSYFKVLGSTTEATIVGASFKQIEVILNGKYETRK